MELEDSNLSNIIDVEASLKKCLTSYDFKKLLTVNHYNADQFKENVRVLMFFIKSDIFYKYEREVQIVSEFVLQNLIWKAKANYLEGVYELITLLYYLLDRLLHLQLINNIINFKRMFDVLIEISNKYKDINKTNEIMQALVKIICLIYPCKNICKADIEYFLNHVFSESVEANQMDNFIILSNLILNGRIELSIAESCLNFILKFFPFNKEEYLSSFLCLVLKFHSKLQEEVTLKESLSNVLKQLNDYLLLNFNDFIILNNGSQYQKEARNILSITLKEYFKTNCHYKSLENYLIELEKLNVNYKNWPLDKQKVFIHIIHLQTNHHQNNELWSKEALFKYLYDQVTHNKFNLCLTDWKIICNLFPHCKINCTEIEENKIVEFEQDLIEEINLKLPRLDQILSENETQFNWIINKGSENLKKETIKFWLRKEQFHIVEKCVSNNLKAFAVIFIEDENIDPDFSEKLIQFINFMKGEALKSFWSILPLIFHNERLFKAVLAAKPKLPDDPDYCCRLGGFLALKIPLLKCPNTLELVCRFCTLLFENCEDKNMFDYFCRSFKSIEYLCNVLQNNESDSLTSSILNIFRGLIKYQQEYNLYIDASVKVDFAKLLNRSKRIGCKAVIILSHVLSGKYFLKLEEDSLHEICQLLPNYCDCLENMVHKIFYIMLNNYPFLAFCYPILIFFQMQCSISENAILLNLLIAWNRILETKPIGEIILGEVLSPLKSYLQKIPLNKLTDSEARFVTKIFELENVNRQQALQTI